MGLGWKIVTKVELDVSIFMGCVILVFMEKFIILSSKY